MLERVMQQTLKIIQNGARKGANIRQKSMTNTMQQKRCEKRNRKSEENHENIFAKMRRFWKENLRTIDRVRKKKRLF